MQYWPIVGQYRGKSKRGVECVFLMMSTSLPWGKILYVGDMKAKNGSVSVAKSHSGYGDEDAFPGSPLPTIDLRIVVGNWGTSTLATRLVMSASSSVAVAHQLFREGCAGSTD